MSEPHKPIPSEELIKEGTIKGRVALEYLDQHREYLYHGSTQKLERLEPRQGEQMGEPDGDPAIAATNRVDIAIFRALISGHASRAKGRDKHYSSFGRHEDGAIHLDALAEDINDARRDDAVGYVHVFKKAEFTPYPRDDSPDALTEEHLYEYRSHQPVVPTFVVEVNGKDLPKDIGLLNYEDGRPKD